MLAGTPGLRRGAPGPASAQPAPAPRAGRWCAAAQHCGVVTAAHSRRPGPRWPRQRFTPAAWVPSLQRQWWLHRAPALTSLNPSPSSAPLLRACIDTLKRGLHPAAREGQERGDGSATARTPRPVPLAVPSSRRPRPLRHPSPTTSPLPSGASATPGPSYGLGFRAALGGGSAGTRWTGTSH